MHAGFARSAEVERRTLELASLLAEAAAAIAPELHRAQIYPLEPGMPDPADGRSDHTSFQERGYTVKRSDRTLHPIEAATHGDNKPDKPEAIQPLAMSENPPLLCRHRHEANGVRLPGRQRRETR